MKNKYIILFLYCLAFGVSRAQTIKTDLTYSVQLPAKKTNKTPVLILLHGYGSNEADLFDLSKTMDPRFITFSLRAPNPSKEGGFCWYELEFTADKTFKYDYRQAELSRAKIRSFISNACKTFGVDSTQVFLLGFSQGAIMAYDLAISAPAKIKGVIALSGRLMKESTVQKTNVLQLAKVNFFIGHGNFDNVIHVEEAEKAQVFLKEKKVENITLKYYDMPHSLSGQELNDIKAWLAKGMSSAKKAEVKE